MPFLVLRRDHLRSTSGIICGSGSFAVQFGDHFRSRDHSRSGIICGAVQATLSPRKTDFSQSIWAAGDQLTTAFTTPNCLEHEFLKGFLVQGRQQSFWKSSILSNILDLLWCLPNKRKVHSQPSAMFSYRDGKGGELSSQASKML